ncbi:MAG: hypothetical protein B6D72_09675 [gamma proteobacterium symbiont of Ctena orbiculata]|nr:tautomerase family protein [Candidatus Thiodiazotropha taylori]MBT3035385.1 tautomerase family protein [Candidatus Thiodiazotropha taylori]PVV10196.1 MAG: hypothetical protein B6D82_13035 [gamma proteobacterium symbiont of Ctena orbiculata]PVV11614.1 MAG: hypothetical protein B6D72_09675 [gamma proteobacterium symbiont of Ctena orbiculata]PVV27056.1 MAG: hypothetical protein B6D74_00100 [gamma proteobacterium symbiont of Ctena orbiculata]
MPVIRITLTGEQPTPSQYRDLQQETTRLMAEVMAKRPAVTVVLVQSLPAMAWSIGGSVLDGLQRGAQVEIMVTAGTNSAQEKAAMIDATYKMLDDSLGPLPEASYVVIHEIAADAWGYGGVTQQARQGLSAAL